MKHKDNAAAEPQSSWHQWLLVTFTLVTLVFGFWGYWEYETKQDRTHSAENKSPTDQTNQPNAFSVAYHTGQLLIAHGAHLEREIPWQLHVGRLAGVALLFTAALIAFLKFFREEMLLFRLRLPWRWGHVVICGLGDLGVRLALDGRKLCPRKFIVAIEKHADPTTLELARKHGVLVFAADACDISQLRKACVHRAEFIVAACDDDKVNVAVASLAGDLVKSGQRRKAWKWAHPLRAVATALSPKPGPPPLVCRLLIQTSELHDVFG